jgi:hypothetical protein
MISERDFSTHHSSFWRETLPNLESVTRSLNLASTTEWDPMPDLNDPLRRDLIAETAFNLAALKFDNGTASASELLPLAQKFALRDLGRLTRRFIGDAIQSLSEQESKEVHSAYRRFYLLSISLAQSKPTVFRPRFRGHGFIRECEGDLLAGRDIYEFKYVSRNFRSSDFKQALIYSVLQWFGTGEEFENIILVNPFKGVIASVAAEELINASGGGNFYDFCYRFSYYTGSGDISR